MICRNITQAVIRICKGGSVQLKAARILVPFHGHLSIAKNPNIINPIATPDTTTKFTVNLTDQFGCKNSDTNMLKSEYSSRRCRKPIRVLYSVFTNTSLDAKLAHTYENVFSRQ